MRLYYTQISAEDTPQTRPDLSLGGFKSSSLVPNNSFSNLFSDISCYSVSENRDEYIALALVNETGVVAENVTFYFDYQDAVDIRQMNVEFAFVAFNVGGEIEVVPNTYAQPLNATFQASDGELNSVNVGDIAIDGKIAIWFKKIINTTNILEEQSNDNMAENGTPQPANQIINLIYFYNLALLTTDAITAIADVTATGGGEITDDSGYAVTARGVCWSTEELPTIADSLTSDGSGTGVFVSSLTGLTAETTYYVRSYATNSQGTSYGNQVSFTTLA